MFQNLTERDVETKPIRSSWIAFLMFYIILVLIITVLDWFNNLFSWTYWGAQVGLITLGVGTLAVIGMWIQDLTAA